jgi:hypothetical protein
MTWISIIIKVRIRVANEARIRNISILRLCWDRAGYVFDWCLDLLTVWRIVT